MLTPGETQETPLFVQSRENAACNAKKKKTQKKEGKVERHR